MKIATCLLCLLAGIPATAQSVKEISKVWVADNGDGTYKNPVIYADYSDPDAIRVGDDYYLVASSFDAVPGLPILHSRDLVNWRIAGHALLRQPPFRDRMPIFGGDDTTDMDVFHILPELHGHGFSVGRAFDGVDYEFGSPRAVREWLSDLAERGIAA